jgi:hypothetical protein
MTKGAVISTQTKRKTAKKPAPKRIEPIDYLRIGRAIGKQGYCGECIGCMCYRDFCDYADDLQAHDREKEK